MMAAMTEFMRQSQDIILFAGKIQQQIRVMFGCGGSTKRAAAFAVAGRNIDQA